jgi:DNA-binding IscR family transcriptional regulator
MPVIYGIQALREYRKAGGVLTNEEIARRLDIDRNYAFKVNRCLKLAGFIEAVRGPCGGYVLAQGAAGRTIAEFIAGMDGGVLAPEDGDTKEMGDVRALLRTLLVEGGWGKSVKSLL